MPAKIDVTQNFDCGGKDLRDIIFNLKSQSKTAARGKLASLRSKSRGSIVRKRAGVQPFSYRSRLHPSNLRVCLLDEACGRGRRSQCAGAAADDWDSGRAACLLDCPPSGPTFDNRFEFGVARSARDHLRDVQCRQGWGQRTIPGGIRGAVELPSNSRPARPVKRISASTSRSRTGPWSD